MAPIAIANAKLEVVQFSCGRMRVLFDGKPMPGLIKQSINVVGPNRAELTLTFHGLAFKLSSDPRSRSELSEATLLEDRKDNVT